MTLEKKITRLVLGIFVAVVIGISFFSLIVIRNNVRSIVEKRLIDTAYVIAANPMIQTELEKKSDPTYMKVQNFVETMRLKVNLLFISVIDMEGIRYSHPIPHNIGRKFLGGDEKAVLENADVYVSEGVGHLGKSIRGFVPVYKDGVQVGAVIVGISNSDLRHQIAEYFNDLLPIFLIEIVIIVYLSKRLARNIKSDIYGLEPEEIAVKLREKDSIISNMEEGLIAVNNFGKVTVINKKALQILSIDSEEDIDKQIMALLEEVMYRRSRFFNKEIRINTEIIIMANFYSIIGEYGKIAGAVVTFQDFTKVHKMAEELTGVKELTWNLRAQNHEFMNKLHTIAGLIQLEETDKVIEYIFETTEKRYFITDSINKIKDSSIQGLIFSKYNRADEMKIKFEVDGESCLKEINYHTKVQDLVTIIGNLIENSIEEVRSIENPWIYVGIYQEEKIKIIIKNNGKKIDDELKKKIFQRGYSTKGECRGLGLYNISNIVSNLSGSINIYSDEITVWEVII